MASLESEAGSVAVSSNGIKNRATKNRKNKTKNAAFRYLPKFRCFSLKSETATTDAKGSFDMEAEDDETGRKMNPTHLVIMVNGLVGR